jgi:uncharacterized protein YicC (UPF0701 family)
MRKFDVETLSRLFDEMSEICTQIEEEAPEVEDHWSAKLFTEFDAGLCSINNVLSELQLMVQKGDIK